MTNKYFQLACATRKKGNYDHVTSMFFAWLMPHLYFTKTSRACSCIASGSEQTVAFIAAGSSGLRSLLVPLERCVGWGGSNFICKFQYTISVCFGRLFLVCIWLFVFTKYMYFYRGELTSFFHLILRVSLFLNCFMFWRVCEWRLALSVCYSNFK